MKELRSRVKGLVVVAVIDCDKYISDCSGLNLPCAMFCVIYMIIICLLPLSAFRNQ